MSPVEELEFIAREYTVVTMRLVEVLDSLDDEEVPASIKIPLEALANAINKEWNNDG